MGSYPTHATPALAQLLQLGSFWSQRFLRKRQRLHALTLRKLELFPPAALAAWWPAWRSSGDSCSWAGDGGSAELWRWRFAGCEFGDGGSWREACIACSEDGGQAARRGKGEVRVLAALPASLRGGTAVDWGRGRHLMARRCFGRGALAVAGSQLGVSEAQLEISGPRI